MPIGVEAVVQGADLAIVWLRSPTNEIDKGNRPFGFSFRWLMADRARAIIHSYFHQFTCGRDKFVCDFADCRSYPSFSRIFHFPNAAVHLVIEYAHKYQSARLCDLQKLP
jgi:hypothetical protein